MSTLEILIHVEALVFAAFGILIALSGIASLWTFRKIARLASYVAHHKPGRSWTSTYSAQLRASVHPPCCIPDLIRALANAVFQRVFHLCYQLKMRFYNQEMVRRDETCSPWAADPLPRLAG
jgi:hypothetical protein